MLCSECAANLPEGSQFCLKCGQPVPVPVKGSARVVTAALGCSKCGAALPEDAEFCLKCGKPVSLPSKREAAVEVLPPVVGRPRPKRKRTVLWLLLLVLLLTALLWVVMSDNPFAQQAQELVGWKHDQTILEAPFSVGPHTFRYYKFSLPEGSVNVAVIGQFASTGDSQSSGNRKEKDKSTDKDKDRNKDPDNNIEVYVLSESAFTVWQNGYATSSLYESGKVAEGNVQADIPAGAGIYYLVFSNKSSPNTPKSVRATVLLRYKSWLPDWFRTMKGRVLDWFGV